MHDPESYYPRRFINDFETFWASMKEVEGDLRRFSAGSPVFFSRDFVWVQGRPDPLGPIHKGRRIPFLYGLMFSFFWDQLLHTHFGAKYPLWNLSLFQQGHRLGMLSHPKLIAEGTGQGEFSMERPWNIFGPDLLQSRDWKLSDLVTGFRPYAEAMVRIWGKAVERRELEGLDWVSVCQALLHDPHVAESHFGRMMQETAQVWNWSAYHAA